MAREAIEALDTIAAVYWKIRYEPSEGQQEH
jgi:hypothetical protein